MGTTERPGFSQLKREDETLDGKGNQQFSRATTALASSPDLSGKRYACNKPGAHPEYPFPSTLSRPPIH